MTYSSGGLIQAADYNGFTGGNLGANVSGQLNSVWGGGLGDSGYGQPAVSNVTAVSDTVTATQWTTLLNTINAVRKHQAAGAFTNIGTVATGDTISVISDISSNLTTATTNRLVSNNAGVTLTGSTFSPVFSVASQVAATYGLTRTVTFSSADQARYFFNAGGQINLVVASVTNNDATNRSADLATLLATNFASLAVLAANNNGRTGTGGTLTSSNTSLGYYNATTANTSAVKISSTDALYSGDYVEMFVKTNGVQGSYSDNGTTMDLSLFVNAADQTATGFNDTVNITINHRVDVVYPETTFLANTWGSVTVS